MFSSAGQTIWRARNVSSSIYNDVSQNSPSFVQELRYMAESVLVHNNNTK
ncbi:hypothetical protein LguiA_023902 [Lonicera macranthoides]